MPEVDNQFFGLLVVLLKLVILSMLLERAMIILFEWRWYEKFLGGRGLKVPITYIVAWTICTTLEFDAFLTIIEPGQAATNMGMYLTAAVLAGGSAGAITLFQNVLRMTKSAQKSPPSAKSTNSTEGS